MLAGKVGLFHIDEGAGIVRICTQVTRGGEKGGSPRLGQVYGTWGASPHTREEQKGGRWVVLSIFHNISSQVIETTAINSCA